MKSKVSDIWAGKDTNFSQRISYWIGLVEQITYAPTFGNTNYQKRQF